MLCHACGAVKTWNGKSHAWPSSSVTSKGGRSFHSTILFSPCAKKRSFLLPVPWCSVAAVAAMASSTDAPMIT